MRIHRKGLATFNRQEVIAKKSKKVEPEVEEQSFTSEVHEEYKRLKAKLKAADKKFNQLFDEEHNTRFYLVVVFPSPHACQEFAEKAQLYVEDWYVDGMQLAEHTGIRITTPAPRVRKYKAAGEDLQDFIMAARPRKAEMAKKNFKITHEVK